MDLSYGYGNIAKSGQSLPVSVCFTNDTEETIEGFLSLEIIENGGTFSYTGTVSVPPGTSEVRRTVTVPEAETGEGTDSIRARLFDDSGKDITTAEIRVVYQGGGKEAFVGLLSEEPALMEYFGNVSLSESLSTRAIPLSAADLTEDAEGLSQLDMIVISGFETEQLSPEVVEAIVSWVEKGGILLLGTGQRAQPLGGFRTYLEDCDLGNAVFETINPGSKYFKTGLEEAGPLLAVRRISWSGAEPVVLNSDADAGFLWQRSFEKGSICLCSADLCDLSAFAAEHPGFAQDLLLSVIGQTGLSRITAGLTGTDSRLEAATALTNTFSEEKIPSPVIYLIFAAAFIFTAGSLLFTGLKNRGLGIYYMLGVLILSAAATLVCWLLSSSTRTRYPFIDYGIITEYSEKTAADPAGMNEINRGFINIESPNQSALTLELSGQCTIRPVLVSGNSSLTEGKRQMLAVTGQKQFEKNIYQVEEKTAVSGSTLPLAVSLKTGEDGISGTVTNTGTVRFQCLSLITGVSAIRLGALEPGQSVSFREEDLVYGPMSIGALSSVYLTEADAGLLYPDQKKNLISYELSESMALEEGKVLLLGFAEAYTPDFLPSTRYTLQGSTLLVLECQISEPEEGSFVRILNGSMSVLSGTCNIRENTISGSAEVTLEQYIGGSYRVEGIVLQTLSPELSGQEVTGFRGQMSLYNYSTGKFDTVSTGKTSWAADELANYLSPANTMIIRYLPEEEQNTELPMFLPLLEARLTTLQTKQYPVPEGR